MPTSRSNGNANFNDFDRVTKVTNQFSLPWSEEESKIGGRNGNGYDGELTAMTFKHVVGSDVFDQSK